MIVIVLVCVIGHPCDVSHARAYQAYRAPEGVIVCGIPGMLPLQNEALAAQDGEETHVKCRIGENSHP